MDTLPKDVSSGQRLASSAAVALLALHDAAGDSLLVANSRNCAGAPLALGECSQSGAVSQIVPRRYEDAVAMRGPVAVAASPDGLFVYAAGYLSRNIACFQRDPASGLLTVCPAGLGVAGTETSPPYSVDVAHSAARPPYADYLRPLQGLADVSLNPQGTVLCAAAAAESAVYVFDRDPGSGRLTQAAVIRDGEQLGGRLMAALGGASAVHVTGNGTLVVGAGSDMALSVLSLRLNGSGVANVTYVDMLRNGERLFAPFEARLRARPFDADPSFANSSGPKRAAGLDPALRSARAAANFEVGGVVHLAIVFGGVQLDGSQRPPCAQCPAHAALPLNGSELTDCACERGYTGVAVSVYGDQGIPCQPCPAGTYKNTSGSGPCVACPDARPASPPAATSPAN